MTEQKPVNPVKRSQSNEIPAHIDNMAQRKRPSWKKVVFYLLLILAVSAGALWYLGVIQLPIAQNTPSKTATIATQMVATTTITSSATATQTMQPSATPTPTATATATPTATATATEKPMPYVLKGTPQPLSSKLFYPSLGCEYLLIGGEVWDLQDSPVIGKTVHLGGKYGDDMVNLFVLTGDATRYGKSGYEFRLDNKQINSSGSMWIRLEDEMGMPLSGITYLDISDSCQENLILINFKQVR